MSAARRCRILLLAFLWVPFLHGVSRPAAIRSGETRSDSIGAGESSPWTFNGNQGERIIVTAVTPVYESVNTTIRLRRLGSATDEAQSGCEDRLDHALESTDSYTVFVEDCGLSAIGTYKITFVKVLPDSVDSTFDPDGGPIASGQTIFGQVQVLSDIDGFQFFGESGQRIVVSAGSRFSQLTLDTRIRLYPPNGAAQAAESECGDRLEHVLGSTGIHTAFVEDCSLTGTGAYDITLVKILPDSMTSAGDPDGGPIASGETRTGVMNIPSDIDGFQFSGQSGERIVIAALAITGTPVHIRLYPPDGGPQEDESNCDGRFDPQLAATGVYTILVEDCGLAGINVYKITFAKILPDSMSSSGDPDGGLITPGQTRTGTVNSVADFDGYHFFANAGEGVSITASLNTRIRLYSPNGGPQLAESGCANHLDHLPAATGVYTILIEDCSLTNRGSYSVNLFVLGSTGTPIASGQTLPDQVQTGPERRPFQFFGSAGERVIVTAVRTSGNLDTRIRLFPPAGAPQVAESACTDRLEHQLDATGVHTILVEDCGLLFDRSGTFNVSFIKFQGAISTQGDPDGGLINLVQSAPGFPVIDPIPGIPAAPNGTLGPSDFDVFQFYGAPGDTAGIGASLFTRIRLYPPNGGPPLVDTGLGSPNACCIPLPAMGLYSMTIESFDLLNTMSYTVRAFKRPSAVGSGIYFPQPPVGGSVSAGGGVGSLRWEAVLPNPVDVRYDLYLGSDILASLPLVYADLPESAAPVPILSAESVYYWQVVAHTATETVSSPVWWFLASNATDVAPDPVPLAGPVRVLGFPNPFNRTSISFFVAQPDWVRLTIHDARGRLVESLVNRWHASGSYAVSWDGRERRGVPAGSGVYMVRLVIGADVRTHKLVLAK